MKEQIKELRVKIDGLAQLTKELKPINKYEGTRTHPFYINSKEIEKTVDSLYLAKAWLGKVLGELGSENPYGSGYKTKEDIVPTADVARQDVPTPFDGSRNHIEKIDWLRQEVKKLNDESLAIRREFREAKYEIQLYIAFVIQYLTEARFWLGFELQRIKEENKNK